MTTRTTPGRWFRLAVATMMSWTSVAWAHEASAHAAAVSPVSPETAWHFTLPTLDGSRFVTLSDARGPVLVNFWGRECPPCVHELPLLAQFARDHPDWTVMLVATDPPAQARPFIEGMNGLTPSVPGLVWLKGGASVATLMRSAGNSGGALPYTLAWRQAGGTCHQQLGLLSQTALSSLVVACTHGDAAPSP